MDQEKLKKAFWLMPPRMVVLVSSVDSLGNENLAPHSEFVKLHTNELLVAVEKEHDTYKNILETKEFVVGLPSISIAKAISISGKPFPRGVSEFKHAGLTPVKSKVVKAPSIKECLANFECKLTKQLGFCGGEALFVGEIVDFSIGKAKITDEEKTRLESEVVLHVYKGRVFTTITGRKVDTGIDYKNL